MNNEAPSTEKKFDILYETLEKYNQRYVTASLATASVLLVIIGWLLTNDVIHIFFEGSCISTIVFVFFIVPFLILSYVYPMLRVYKVNQDAYNYIVELNYIDKKYYECHKLTLRYKYIGLILNSANYLIMGILVANAHWKFL